MAIKYSTVERIQKEKDNAPLNDEELAHVENVEKYIDEEILKKFGTNPKINIDLSVASFRYDPANKITNYQEVRRGKMQAEIEKRYKNAGWRVSYHFDDMLDGPNMSGSDYMILEKKTREK
jgi:hypothetical protein